MITCFSKLSRDLPVSSNSKPLISRIRAPSSPAFVPPFNRLAVWPAASSSAARRSLASRDNSFCKLSNTVSALFAAVLRALISTGASGRGAETGSAGRGVCVVSGRGAGTGRGADSPLGALAATGFTDAGAGSAGEFSFAAFSAPASASAALSNVSFAAPALIATASYSLAFWRALRSASSLRLPIAKPDIRARSKSRVLAA